MAQLMPLPLTVSSFNKIQIDFTFLAPAHPGSRGQRAVKWVCVKPFQQSRILTHSNTVHAQLTGGKRVLVFGQHGPNRLHLGNLDTHPFNGPLSGTTRVSRYQKGKTNLDFAEARDSERQWHQLGHMQVCTSLQTDNHASTPPLSFLQAGCPVKAI